jgi:ribosomal protein S18 acetylase RimI-like enzyme
VGADGLKPHSPITLRDCDERRDLEAVRACIIELQEFERQYEPSMPEGHSMVEAYLTLMLARCRQWQGKILVAEIDSEVVGFTCVWGRVPSEEPDDNPADYAYISDLLVRAGYRRRGVARRLMDAAEQYARGCGAGVLRVQALARNAAATSFYGRYGFSEFQIEMAKRLA